jgi:Hg(II)-responsive transcriptional regulator
MRIGEVAAQAAVNIQTLRYYERLGLVPDPARSPSGYRSYQPQTVRRVRFIKRAQDLGFTLAEIADLLGMRERAATACEQVEARASATLERIEEKIRDLERMRLALDHYVSACRTQRPIQECPLLAALDQTADEPRSSRVVLGVGHG